MVQMEPRSVPFVSTLYYDMLNVRRAMPFKGQSSSRKRYQRALSTWLTLYQMTDGPRIVDALIEPR
jgi:hypothetical protein